MTIYEFQIFCDVSSWGWGYAPIGHMGGVYPYMGTPQRHRFLGTTKCVTPYYYWRVRADGNWIYNLCNKCTSPLKLSVRIPLMAGTTPTCRKLLAKFITSCCIKSTSPSVRFELKTLVVIGAEYTGNCKSNYHAITTTTALS